MPRWPSDPCDWDNIARKIVCVLHPIGASGDEHRWLMVLFLWWSNTGKRELINGLVNIDQLSLQDWCYRLAANQSVGLASRCRATHRGNYCVFHNEQIKRFKFKLHLSSFWDHNWFKKRVGGAGRMRVRLIVQAKGEKHKCVSLLILAGFNHTEPSNEEVKDQQWPWWS